MKIKQFIWLAGAITTIALASCGTKDKSANDYTNAANCTNVIDSVNTYTLTIASIMDDDCAYSGCHNSASHKGGVTLETYQQTKDCFANSNGLCTVNHDCRPMPEGEAKLSDLKLSQLACWVKNNCPE